MSQVTPVYKTTVDVTITLSQIETRKLQKILAEHFHGSLEFPCEELTKLFTDLTLLTRKWDDVCLMDGSHAWNGEQL